MHTKHPVFPRLLFNPSAIVSSVCTFHSLFGKLVPGLILERVPTLKIYNKSPN